MADLMWSTVKEPLDTTLCFDKESLDLAFKYFMSPTLTMRLAGLSQITVSYVSFVLDDCFVCLLDKHNTSEGLYVWLNAVLHGIFCIAFTIFEMAQWLRVFAAHPGALFSSQHPHCAANNHSCNCGSGAWKLFSGSCGLSAHTHINPQTYT